MSGPYKNYTLGRGELSFAQSITQGAAPLPGAAFRYLGNSPDLSQTASSTNLDHYDSDHGIKVKDDSIILQFDRTGKFSLDSMDVANLAMYFIAQSTNFQQAAITAKVENVTVGPDTAFQLGTSVNALGVKNVSTVTAKNHTTPATIYVPGTDFIVDPASGWVKIPTGSAIPAGTSVDFTFDAAASSRIQLATTNNVLLEGALKFRSFNPKGPKYDYFWPYVQLTPDGDFTMKGDTWQQMNFNFSILDPSDGRASMYLDGAPVVVP